MPAAVSALEAEISKVVRRNVEKKCWKGSSLKFATQKKAANHSSYILVQKAAAATHFIALQFNPNLPGQF